MASPTNSPIKIVSYNILVPHYAHVNKPVLKDVTWEDRRDQLVSRMVSLNPDVIGLQEVERFGSIAEKMWQKGYTGLYSGRNNGEEEGCAIFYKTDRFQEITHQPFFFNDGTGRLAFMASLKTKDGKSIFNVLSTHIQYPMGNDKTEKEIDATQKFASTLASPTIICGDFNVDPDSKYLSPLYIAGFKDSHKNSKKHSFDFSGNSSRIDFIFATPDINVISADVPGNTKDLSTLKEPSDHLPIIAELTLPLNGDSKDEATQMREIVEKLNSNQLAEAKALFAKLPTKIQNSVYGNVYELEKNNNSKAASHPRFGECAFLQQDDQNVSNATRAAAITKYLDSVLLTI